MLSEVSFVLDGRIVRLDFRSPEGPTPTTTLLNYLRSVPTHKGLKEGCAEGDCGACTVVLGVIGPDERMHYRAVDSCLVFLPMIHGKQVITVEDLQSRDGTLHPVQQTMVETNGSQCGFCTPGIIMSLFALYKTHDHPDRHTIDDALTGNLCRCTGYKPIIEAAARACVNKGMDHFTGEERETIALLQRIPRENIHIKTSRQEYFRPVSLAEALALKHSHKDTVTISGATDVALRVTKKHELIPKILDISDVEELHYHKEDDTTLTLGAGLILNTVLPLVKTGFPALAAMLEVFGSGQIRNLSTLGGNLGTASPIGDTLPVLMAYNARVILQSAAGTRELSIHDYFKGYRQTERRPDELVTGVILPKVQPNTVVRSYKISKRKDLDISTLSGGFRLQLNPHNNVVESVRLAYGGMAERVKRARTVEQFLIGKKWERGIVEEAMVILHSEFTPISDARSSAEFRTVAARNLLLKFWSETSMGRNGAGGPNGLD